MLCNAGLDLIPFKGLKLHLCPMNHVKYVAVITQENLIRIALRLRRD